MKAHDHFKRHLLAQVPPGWNSRLEGAADVVGIIAKWRADVLVWRDACIVALEAQCAPIFNFEERCKAYISTGVWPIWFQVLLLKEPMPKETTLLY